MKFACAEDFGSPAEDIERRWALVERDFGASVGGPSTLCNLSPAQKWQIVVMYDLRKAAAAAEADREELGQVV